MKMNAKCEVGYFFPMIPLPYLYPSSGIYTNL